MKDWSRHLLFLAFYRLVVLLPKRWASPVASALACLSVAFGLRRHVVLRNLGIAFGHDMSAAAREQLYRDNMRASWLTVIEILWMARHDREWVRQRASISGWEHVEQALAQGRGALLLGGHFGNWELQNAALALAAAGRCYSYTGQQHSTYFDSFMTRLRVRAGVRPVSRSPEATRKMIQLLKENSLMGICVDQNASRAAIFAPFFGKLAAVPEGMAMLATKLDCPVLFSWIVRVGPFRHQVVIRSLTFSRTGSQRQDCEALARCFLEQLEEVIRAHPADYLWMHRRYRTRPAADPDPVY
jgi:KDO2-lipid IV(A) lauroyltransferase